MEFPLPIPPQLREAVPRGTGVLVALSGGVDSSVALALLAHLGCEVAAVTFKNFCYGDEAVPARPCCSLDAIAAARRVAGRFGAAHWVADVAELFREAVIAPFVAEYGAGRTPNPCQACNARVRFPELARLADRLGLARVATGHYALVTGEDESLRLRRGRDPEKDQSYFLYGIGRPLLARSLFPLGWYTKRQVRSAAAALELPTAAAMESQEICFVPDNDRAFLFAAGAAAAPGDIVDRAGRVLGRHRGLAFYTVGQRRGLGVSAPRPLYVLSLDRDANRVVVGPREQLAVRSVFCDRFVAAAALPAEGPPAGLGGGGHDPARWQARIRHRHPGAPVARWRIAGERLEVAMATTLKGVAPGQSLVLYDDDTVLGGGRIVATA